MNASAIYAGKREYEQRVGEEGRTQGLQMTYEWGFWGEFGLRLVGWELMRVRVLRDDGGSGRSEVVLYETRVWVPLPACIGEFGLEFGSRRRGRRKAETGAGSYAGHPDGVRGAVELDVAFVDVYAG